MSDPTPAAANDLGAPDRPSADGGSDTAFHTDTATANGARQRGMGVGARELDAQRDPNANPTSPADDLPIRGPDDADSPPDSNGRA